jgi:peptide subunit release factor 1 (eRF1)
MITRDDIGELAHFDCDGGAVSFYYQPSTPQNKSHRDEAIRIKDLVKQAMMRAEKEGRNGKVRPALDRIIELAERLHGNQGRAKAVFACPGKNIWREFDLPPQLADTTVSVANRFHLRPLTAIAGTLPHICIALAGRTTARVFDLWGGEITEHERFVSELPRKGRSDGFEGFDAGHAERHVEDHARQHFKRMADTLLMAYEGRGFDRLILGCRDENWPELEPQLHPYVKQKLIGRFPFDSQTLTLDDVKENAERLLAEFRANRYRKLFGEVTGEAQRNGRGALGPKRVLRSLETGEVQTLLLGQSFRMAGSECTNCGHLDATPKPDCTLCGGKNRDLEDVSDAMLIAAVRNGIEIVHVQTDPEFEKVGNVAALLRFRADKNTNAALQPAAAG